MLRGTACRLCCPFSAARGIGAGRHLTGQPSLGRADSAANPSPEGYFRPDFQEFWDFLGGKKTVATPRISAKLRVVPFGKVARGGRALNGYVWCLIGLCFGGIGWCGKRKFKLARGTS